MAPSPGDDTQSSSQDSKGGGGGGLAGVFKGLAGAAKLTKAPPSSFRTPGSIIGVQHSKNSPAAIRGLDPHHIEAFQRLKDGTPEERVAAAHTLRHAVVDYPLNPVLDMWYAAKDMIEPDHPPASRLAGWELLTECAKHHDSTDLERREYFQTIAAPAHPDDFHMQLAALVDLTQGGRNISGFDYDVFPLLSAWLGNQFSIVRAARNAAKRQNSRYKGKAIVTGEDKNFHGLFGLTSNVIKFNFNIANDEAAGALIDALLHICMNAAVEDDLRACIGVLEAIVTFGVIPSDKLKSCVQVLSSIHCLVPNLQKDAWHTFSILCRSHNGQATLRLLLEVLSNIVVDPERNKEGVREVRGALSVLQKLLPKDSEKGYPAVPYSVLVEGLSTVVQATSAWKVHLDILRLTNSLFCNAKGDINSILVDEDWAPLLDVVVSCSSTVLATDSSVDEGKPPLDREELPPNSEALITEELQKLLARIEVLLRQKSNSFLQRVDCYSFFLRIHPILPDSSATMLLDHCREFRSCFPSDDGWEETLILFLEAFLANRSRSTEVRIKALRFITAVYDVIDVVGEDIDPEFVPSLIERLLDDVADETDTTLLQELVSFASSVACTADMALFSRIVDMLRGILSKERMRSPISALSPGTVPPVATGSRAQPGQTPSNVVTKGYITIFMRVMGQDVVKADRIFQVLVSIVKSSSQETDARLTAMKLLFRLRSDWANRVYVALDTESSNLASSLYRTEESISRREAEEQSQLSRSSTKTESSASARSSRGKSFSSNHPPDRALPVRSVSAAKLQTTVKYKHMWSASEAAPLPENTTQAASPVLFSCAVGSDSESDAEVWESAQDRGVLKTSTWLGVVLNLIQNGCDWEVYSFILIHLPSQLSNHAFFTSAVRELQELRRVVCELIRTNGFPEPPNVYGLRRADVAICLFHTLTMIMSYHQYFTKTEEDEIVRTFVHGIATWERSAKCCIHALSICCHELPASTGKALVTILQKMAQIVTQPQVAMHILEFLACLYRIPSLYVNFREDEYRIVFGICFRYLQYVRDKRQSLRPTPSTDSTATILAHASADSSIRPSASDDLPQYVYALAFHVIAYWFLAMKLPDRVNQVSWIAKNLFIEADGSHYPDEQAQITIDFMQRATYADVDESTADPYFTSDRFGEIMTKRWLVGNSIVTIQQAIHTGWAQITKSHPSGSSSYMIRENFSTPPPHQRTTNNDRDTNMVSTHTVLPNHLLVLLLASYPQGVDIGKPIPLPDDDAVDRSIRLFNRISTVDGHKVGVIYIGENQTNEVDILANVAGSGDYLQFLNGLGTLTRLKDATFNTQGLDRAYDTDGQYTFCWRDRLTEIVFHVTTQMPTNLERDPQCTAKKRHIGNDFVNIIFNDSGFPFNFDTFPSEFNFVNIVITPESRASFVAMRHRTPDTLRKSFYKVQLMSKPGFPEISPASDTKIVSLEALPDFIRLLALNASVFSLVWANRDGEHVSSWRGRLKEINRLREKYGPKSTQAPNPSPPGTSPGPNSMGGSFPAAAQLEAARAGNVTVRDSFTSFRRSSVATFFSNTSEQSHRSSLSAATTDNTDPMTNGGSEPIFDSVDFSKWA